MERVFDVAVIGSGPAGAVFSILSGSCADICIIDRKKGKGGFSKPCGGLISPDARKALKKIGLEVPESVKVSPQPDAVRTICADTGLECLYPRNYTNVDRDAFDSWLNSLIPDCVERIKGVCCGIERDEDRVYKVIYSFGGEKKYVYAYNIVGADGGSSFVRRYLYGNDGIRKYTAIQAWFRETDKPSGYACVFDPETTDCCAWSISKNGYLVYGGAFPAKECRDRFKKHLLKMRKTGYSFSEPVKYEACTVLRPQSLKYVRTGRDHAFLIGEAAGFISPSSLEGISFAVYSATELADVFNNVRSGKNAAYDKKVFYLKFKILLRLMKSPFMYNPTLRSLVMKSGVASMKKR